MLSIQRNVNGFCPGRCTLFSEFSSADELVHVHVQTCSPPREIPNFGFGVLALSRV